MRHKLQEERASITHKFKVGDHEGYITVGLYPDGDARRTFITMAKEGSTVSGLMDSFALRRLDRPATRRTFEVVLRKIRSHPLRAQRMDRQSGHRLREVDHGLHLPLAPVALPDRTAADAVRQLAAASIGSRASTGRGRRRTELRAQRRGREPGAGSIHAADALAATIDLGDAPSCSFCGAIMTRNGSCYRCGSCGSTSGCSEGLCAV